MAGRGNRGKPRGPRRLSLSSTTPLFEVDALVESIRVRAYTRIHKGKLIRVGDSERKGTAASLSKVGVKHVGKTSMPTTINAQGFAVDSATGHVWGKKRAKDVAMIKRQRGKSGIDAERTPVTGAVGAAHPGRGPKGSVRNFRNMDDDKLEAVAAAILKHPEGKKDVEAQKAVKAELGRRFGGDKPAKAKVIGKRGTQTNPTRDIEDVVHNNGAPTPRPPDEDGATAVERKRAPKKKNATAKVSDDEARDRKQRTKDAQGGISAKDARSESKASIKAAKDRDKAESDPPKPNPLKTKAQVKRGLDDLYDDKGRVSEDEKKALVKRMAGLGDDALRKLSVDDRADLADAAEMHGDKKFADRVDGIGTGKSGTIPDAKKAAPKPKPGDYKSPAGYRAAVKRWEEKTGRSETKPKAAAKKAAKPKPKSKVAAKPKRKRVVQPPPGPKPGDEAEYKRLKREHLDNLADLKRVKRQNNDFSRVPSKEDYARENELRVKVRLSHTAAQAAHRKLLPQRGYASKGEAGVPADPSKHIDAKPYLGRLKRAHVVTVKGREGEHIVLRRDGQDVWVRPHDGRSLASRPLGQDYDDHRKGFRMKVGDVQTIRGK
jgi:hypothetical protein